MTPPCAHPMVVIAPSTERPRSMALRAAVASAAVGRKAGRRRHRLGAFSCDPRFHLRCSSRHARAARPVSRGHRGSPIGEEHSPAHGDLLATAGARRGSRGAVDAGPAMPAELPALVGAERGAVGTGEPVAHASSHEREIVEFRHGATAKSSFRNDASSARRDGRARCKDAGSPDTRRIGATEEAAACPHSGLRRLEASLRVEF